MLIPNNYVLNSKKDSDQYVQHWQSELRDTTGKLRSHKLIAFQFMQLNCLSTVFPLKQAAICFGTLMLGHTLHCLPSGLWVW